MRRAGAGPGQGRGRRAGDFGGAARPPEGRRAADRNARLFDSEKARLLPAHDVYIYRGRIAAVYETGSTPREAATVVDAGGRTLLPGLFDMHAHEAAWLAPLHIAAGVTTVRDLANENALLADLSARIDAGKALGARIVPAGFIEGQSDQALKHGFVAASLDEVKQAIDWYAQRGYPQIKLYNSFHKDWVKATTAYAHQRGLRVSGHVPAFMRAEEVVQLGYDEIQHINQVMLNFFVRPGDDTRTLLRFYLVAEKVWHARSGLAARAAVHRLTQAQGDGDRPHAGRVRFLRAEAGRALANLRGGGGPLSSGAAAQLPLEQLRRE